MSIKEGEVRMEEINLKELWHYFLSKISIIFIIVIICVLAGNVYLFCLQTPLYKSTTSLVLVSEESTNTSITQNDITLNNNLVTTYSEIIKSRAVLSKVIENLGLKESVEYLSSCVSVSSIANTQVIKIDVSRESRYEARNIANEIAEVFSKKINISIVDEAELSKSPYNVNFIKQNIIYSVIGIIISCGIVFMIFYFDTSIKDAETIEDKLDLTVFGVVPKVGDKYGSKK